MVLLIYILIILAVGLIIAGTLDIRPFGRRRMRLPEEAAPQKKLQMRSLLDGIFPFTRKLLEKLKLDVKIKSRIDASHIRLSVYAFFNLKILLMLSVGLVTFFAIGKAEPAAIAVALVLGYVIPDLWLRRKISQRKDAIARLLPETVDLLGLCVEAGLDFTTAVKWVIEKIPANPMIEELAFVLEEIKWGKSRTQALKDMSKRLSTPEVSSFVQTLVQAERMGTPVAEAFAILSEDTRLQRFHRGERFAMQAPIKILIPLIFCILPVIAIVIGAPIFLDFMSGGILGGLVK